MYARPQISDTVVRDELGAVIDYGNRWGDEGPPEAAYSVDAHPERFAPLHVVGEALVSHLVDEYEVSVVDDTAVAGDLRHPVTGVVRAVRLVPTDTRCAPLTTVLTSYPGVVVHAGVLHDFSFPECGCDACDESWQGQADELETIVLAIVRGGYREWVRGRIHPEVGMALTRPDGDLSSHGPADDVERAVLRAARRVLDGLPKGRWRPWSGSGPPDRGERRDEGEPGG